MKTIIFAMTLFLISAGVAFGQTETAKSPGSKIVESLTKEEISLTIPRVGVDVDRVALDNGLVIYLYENHKLPLFNIQTLIRCGSVHDASEKDGLSDLVGTVMRTGGTKTITGDSLSMLMEYIGGNLEANIGGENGTVSLSVLSKDADLGLKLFVDLLRSPAFPQDKLDLAKIDIKNNIKRRNDNPGSIVNRYFYNLLYGDYPSGRVLEWASVKNITAQELADYHRRFFTPNNIMIGIYGDFNKTEILAKLRALLADWPQAITALPAPPEVEFKYHPGVYQIRKDLNQSSIMIGQLGIKRNNPDRYAVRLLNYILGGGSFTSRITSRVRSDEGLAYHASSNFNTDSRDYGVFDAECQTKSASTYKATSIIMEEINKIRNDGVTSEEFEGARNAVINSSVFLFDTPGKIINRLMSLEFDGLPPDFYNDYLNKFRRITLADIKSAAQKYLKPDQMTFVIVGNPDAFEKPLDEFGPVTNIELTEPVTE